jgi:signal transduction histidine kinase
MRASVSLLLADRIAVPVRWLAYFILALIFVQWDGFNANHNPILYAMVGWNFLLSVLTVYRLRFPFHSYITIFADAVFLGVLFYFTRTVNGPFIWAGFLPLLSAALYYGLQGGVVVAVLSTLIQTGLALVDAPLGSLLQQSVIWAGVYLFSGVLFGFISRQFGYQLRHREVINLGNQQEGDRVERERLKAIYNITSTLNATLNYERVLDLALDVSNNALAKPGDTAAPRMTSAVLLFETDQLHVGSARRFTPADLRVMLPGVQGVIGRAINTATPVHAYDVASDPELSRIVAMRACKSVFCYPLRSGLDVYGVLIFGHPEEDYFNAERREILEIIGRQAKVALTNAKLYLELEEEKERMMAIQEEAQKKLARDLHDGPTQSVAAIAMRVNFARRLIERDVKSAAGELYKIEDLARRTTKEIRHMLFTLRPLVLESAGLIAALESNAEKMRETFGQNVIIEADQRVVDQLEMGKQGVIFYLAEEAINNARKHAEATHIWVRLLPGRQDLILLEVEDDGVGFNVGAVDAGYESRGSLGMVNMRERTELINGELHIDSEEGRGTRVRVWIPLTEDAAEKLKHGT